jgi:(p)ppGpp synthase/HD superfamily hydrolase
MWSPDLYLDALRFAAERHAGQLMPGTQLPYVVHITSVTAEVMNAIARAPVAKPDLAIAGALLHDTVEDTRTTIEEVAARFGAEIAAAVQALSKDPSLPKSERMADSLTRIRAQPHEVWMVKLADRTVNMGVPPSSWDGDKRRAYQVEARRILAALGQASPYLAKRLAARIDGYNAHLTAS